MQLIYNWTQLHMRTAYEDHPGFENRRHLLRLWLTSTVSVHAIDPQRERRLGWLASVLAAGAASAEGSRAGWTRLAGLLLPAVARRRVSGSEA